MVEIAIDDFIAGGVDAVHLVYPRFVNTLTQMPEVRQICRSSSRRSSGAYSDYIFEPSPEAVLEQLLPRYVEIQVYQAMLDAIASEHSARMVAMRNASENAKDLVNELTLTYNKARQAQITREVSEIAAGASESDRQAQLSGSRRNHAVRQYQPTVRATQGSRKDRPGHGRGGGHGVPAGTASGDLQRASRSRWTTGTSLDARGAAAPRQRLGARRRDELDRRSPPRHGRASTSARPIPVPVGPETLGRILNVVGEPIDQAGPVEAKTDLPDSPPGPVFDEQSTRSKSSRRASRSST